MMLFIRALTVMLAFIFCLSVYASNHGLAVSAQKQIEKTRLYDPVYVSLAYPDGDISL